MAQKRMFDKRVIDTDRFADLPNSTKALYFLAGIYADDRGFFQPRKMQKEYGFTEDDFKILIAKGYFIVFETGVMVITDWNKNNWLDKRRITETEFINELKMLEIINDKYQLEDSAKPMLSQYSIEENSIEEKEIYKEKEIRFIKPTIEEVQNYCKERNNNINAEYFIDYYQSKNWMIGKNKMKDWKACIRTWEKKDFTNKKEEKTPVWFGQAIKNQEMTEEEKTEFKNLIKESEK